MKNDEFKEIIALAKGYYPTMPLISDQQVMRTWYESFANYSVDVVKVAFRSYGESNKFPPSVSDIKQLISNAHKSQISTKDCPECRGRGYILTRVKNDLTRSLYQGEDWAADFAVTCPKCQGWHYITREEVERKKGGIK